MAPEPVDDDERGVTRRAVVVGLACCVAIAAGEPYGVLVLHGSPLAADFSAGAAVFLFLGLTFVANPLVRRLGGRHLGRGELATVYIMAIVAAAIPSWGFTMNLIPLLAGFYYYATPENGWAHLIQPHLPRWLVPRDDEAIRALFEGVSRGEAVPWGQWLQPLLAWGLFIATLYFVTLCLLVMLRKQWVERERLLFPLATLPLEMSAVDGRHALAPFFRNPLTWVGFAVPAFISTVNGLHRYVNEVPSLSLGSTIYILRHTVALHCVPRFEVIGLSYLLSLDVSFGVWVFAVLALLQTGVERMLGFTIGPIQPFSGPAPPTVAHVAHGALLVLVAASFWHSRAHLRGVVRKALRGDETIDDSGELLSYRVAVLGSLVGFGLCLVWLIWAGLTAAGAAVFLLSALVIFIGLARIVSQTGLAYGRATVAAPVFAVNTLGSAAVGASGLTALGLNFAWSADVRTFVMAQVATGLKLAEVTRLEGRRLAVAILLAIAAALVGSAWAVIQIAYTYGGINLVGWQFIGLPQSAGNWITHNINNPAPVHPWHLGFAGAGAVLMSGLMWLKARFVAFPLHPVGLALGLTHPIYHVWFSVFLAWLMKAVILKYGGPRLYARLRPLFLGVVMGAFGSAGLWLVIDHFGGATGNIFTLG